MTTTTNGVRPPTGHDVLEARTLHELGWGPTRIARRLNQEGVNISRFAVGRWVGPTRPRTSRFAVGRERLDRLAALRAGGLSYTGLAVVAHVDYGLNLDAEWMRYTLGRAAHTTPRMLATLAGHTRPLRVTDKREGRLMRLSTQMQMLLAMLVVGIGGMWLRQDIVSSVLGTVTLIACAVYLRSALRETTAHGGPDAR